MKSFKHRFASAVLGREVHADVFEFGCLPSFLCVLFGGSGVDKEEYVRRADTLIPGIDIALAKLEDVGIGGVLLHATAPYDVSFARFDDFPAALRIWNAHVVSELVNNWEHLPIFLCGFSGGAVLALSGAHESQQCIGGAAIGWDGLTTRFSCPAHWRAKLQLICAKNDDVCNDRENRRVATALCRAEAAELVCFESGHHLIADYCSNGALGYLLRFANELAKC